MPRTDLRQTAAAVARNRDPILSVLRRVLPAHGFVLEIASGTGEHAVHFARALPGLTWQPSDPAPDARASIEAWRVHEGLENLLPALNLDATRHPWPLTHADAVVCINMIHIAPWSAAEGLMRGAGAVLDPGGLLYMYGPYRRDGRHTAPSNAAFDEALRRQNPAWGVRDLNDVATLAARHGLVLRDIVEMPANNLSLIFDRVG